MKIVAETKFIDLAKFLKKTYGLDLHVINSSIDDRALDLRTKINKKIEVSFAINNSTEAGDMIHFIGHIMGELVEIRNINGVKLSDKTTIKDGSIITPPSGDTGSVKNDINNAMEVVKSKNYSDLDWFFRILDNSVYKSETVDEKWLVINALIMTAEKSEYFPIERGLQIIQRCFNDDNQMKSVYSQMSNSHSNNVLLMASKLSDWID
jgi:hypothetical protein